MILAYDQGGNRIIVKEDIKSLGQAFRNYWFYHFGGSIRNKPEVVGCIDWDLYHKFRDGKFHITKYKKFKVRMYSSNLTRGVYAGELSNNYYIKDPTNDQINFKPVYNKHDKSLDMFSRRLTWGKSA